MFVHNPGGFVQKIRRTTTGAKRFVVLIACVFAAFFGQSTILASWVSLVVAPALPAILDFGLFL
jgi:hypothetical protein